MMFNNYYNFLHRSPTQNLQYPVLTCQIEWEIDQLTQIYQELKPVRVMEIGVQFGGSLYRWLANAQPGAIIIGMDQWKKSEMPHDPRPKWKSWVPDGVNFYPIIGNSHEQETKDRVSEITDTLDFLFIDGDHTYEGATQDFHMYGPMVAKDGIIAFHDLIQPSFSPHIGVGKLWREIQRAGYITRELYARPEGKQSWGGIGLVLVR